MMLERDIEQYLVKRCKEKGWLCPKFTSPGRRSVPDRIVIMPDARIAFVELKRGTFKATKAQAYEHDKLRKLGHLVFVVGSCGGVDRFLGEMS